VPTRFSQLLHLYLKGRAWLAAAQSSAMWNRPRDRLRAMYGGHSLRENAAALRHHLAPDKSPLGSLYKWAIQPLVRNLLPALTNDQSPLKKHAARLALSSVALLDRASPRLGWAAEAGVRAIQRRRRLHAAELPPAKLLLGPLKFVPHDTDLFSVFNHVAGEIYFGRRIYPIFSCPEARSANGQLKQFAYIDEACPNSWMEFFEPLAYASGDDLHQDIAKLSAMSSTSGHLAAPEFRHAKATMALYNRSDYQHWRWAVHNAVAHMIKPKRDILANIDAMLERMPGHRLGVHVCHPSHLFVQGKILLQHYFSKIDIILKRYPDSTIFLAADNDLAVAAFRYRYGSDRVLCHPGFIRQTVDDVLAWSYSLVQPKSDDMGFVGGIGFQTHYRIAAAGGGKEGIRNGKEAVTDVFTLAACDDFVCTASSFTLACAYLNPRQVQHFVSDGQD